MSHVCNCQRCKGDYLSHKSCRCDKCKQFDFTDSCDPCNQCIPWGACSCNGCWFPDLTDCCHIVRKAFCVFICRANEIIKSTIWKLNELWMCGKICRRQYVIRYGIYIATVEKIIQSILCALKETPLNFSFPICQTPFHKIVEVGIDFLVRFSRYIIDPDMSCNVDIDRVHVLLKRLRQELEKAEHRKRCKKLYD